MSRHRLFEISVAGSILLAGSLIYAPVGEGQHAGSAQDPAGLEKAPPKEGEKKMRWRFGGSDKDHRYRAEMIRRIDSWWKAFETDRGKIVASSEKADDWDLPGWMEKHLHAIDERLMWEYGPGTKGGYRLVITPESDRFLRPLVTTILERAPKIEGWEFHPYRLAGSIDVAKAKLKAQRLTPIEATEVRVRPGEHHLVDLEFHSSRYSGPEDREALGSVFTASEVILGEELLDTWIGQLAVAGKKDGQEGWIGVERMKAAVEEEIARIRNRLPAKPAGKSGGDAAGTMWRLEPEKDQDGSEQRDLFIGKSILPDMWTAAHSDAPFSSARFSGFGEVFCYVKMDGSEGLSGEKLADKAAIEDALDVALKGSSTGAVVGGGTGLRYSYVDLALTDVEKGTRQVVEVLRKRNIVKKTWILFFDDIYRHEWIGVWEDSPPPPGME